MIVHQTGNSRSNYSSNAAFYESESWDFHFHKNLELIYVIRGTVDCVVNNVKYSLCAGDFGLCLPYDIHSYSPRSDTRYWVLVFSEDFVRYFSKLYSGKAALGFPFRCDSSVESYVMEKLINNPSATVMTMKSCLYAVCEEYFSSVPLTDKDLRGAEVSALVADYIMENHTKKISLNDIARKLGYDYNYMSRYFRQVFNMTFTDLVNIYRLETAIELLEQSRIAITDVAYESGFGSVRNFNNFFKSKMGVSPSEYRRQAGRE